MDHGSDSSGRVEPVAAAMQRTPRYGDPPLTRMTIQEAISLTATFDREWFRSLETLDVDVARFAIEYRLSFEELQQVRRVLDVLYASADGENPAPSSGGRNGNPAEPTSG